MANGWRCTCTVVRAYSPAVRLERRLWAGDRCRLVRQKCLKTLHVGQFVCLAFVMEICLDDWIRHLHTALELLICHAALVFYKLKASKMSMTFWNVPRRRMSKVCHVRLKSWPMVSFYQDSFMVIFEFKWLNQSVGNSFQVLSWRWKFSTLQKARLDKQ